MQRFFYTNIDSTNQESKRLIHEEGKQAPFWVIADHQENGRGHGKNSWESAPGLNFCGTYVFNPDRFMASDQFLLAQLVSLGITSFLELFLEDIQIKWPNDIYVQDHKIGGILIENEITGSLISLSTIGIGVNVNQTEFHSEAPNPTSLKLQKNMNFKLAEISQLLETSIENQIHRLNTGDVDNVNEEYHQYLYRYKVFAPYKADNKWFEGRIVGLGDFGEIRIEEKSGRIREFGFKEVEFILV